MYTNSFLVEWIRLAFTPRVGPKTFEKLLKRFQTPINVLNNLQEVKKRYKIELVPPSQDQIEDVLANCNKLKAEVMLSIDANYPILLKEIDNYPHVLFIKGQKSLLSKKKLQL